MATPQRHEEFNDTYDYDYATRSGWNVQNAKVNRGYSADDAAAPANNNYRPMTRYANNPRERYEQNTPANTNAAPTGAAPKRNKIPNPVSRFVAFLKALPTSLWVLSITTFIWGTVQVPASILSIVMFGAAYEASQYWWFDAATKILQYVGYGLGLESTDIIALFFAATGACFFAGLASLGFSWFIYSSAGIESLYGETGVVFKQSTFLLVLLMCFMPGLNFFPWIWLWIAAVTFFPK